MSIKVNFEIPKDSLIKRIENPARTLPHNDLDKAKRELCDEFLGGRLVNVSMNSHTCPRTGDMIMRLLGEESSADLLIIRLHVVKDLFVSFETPDDSPLFGETHPDRLYYTANSATVENLVAEELLRLGFDNTSTVSTWDENNHCSEVQLKDNHDKTLITARITNEQ